LQQVRRARPQRVDDDRRHHHQAESLVHAQQIAGIKGVKQVARGCRAAAAAYVNLEFLIGFQKVVTIVFPQLGNGPVEVGNLLILVIVVQDYFVGAAGAGEGQAVISGIGDLTEAQNLANLLNAGALPAPVTLLSQQTVSATLGSVSLERALYAGLIGTLLIIAFMLLYYRALGFFAAVALVFYVILATALFKTIPITMSLAGIAGFILSIGMAVDANVLIFERTKEEFRKGLSHASAVSEGFRRAWPSIRDSNISTILTAIILYYATSSFVRGFALTLLLGVLVSMFSAITITRTMLALFVKK